MIRTWLLAGVLIAGSPALAGPTTIDLGGRLSAEFIGISEKGRAIWVEAFQRAEELLKKLERAIKNDLEEHERQCFLQEAVKHFIPEVKDRTTITGKPMGDVTPEFLQHVFAKVNEVNRCSPTNRGYLAFHAWKDSGFQEPRQLPSGQKQEMTLSEFIQGVTALGSGVGRAAPVGAPAGAGFVPLLGNPETYMPKKRRPDEGT